MHPINFGVETVASPGASIPIKDRWGVTVAVALVDHADWYWLHAKEWRLNRGYAYYNGPQGRGHHHKQVMMHSLICPRPESDEDLCTDHINRNRLDNRRCNLRVVTRAENSRNTSPPTCGWGTSKNLGVSFNARDRRWKAYAPARVSERRVHLGYFKTEEEAIHAVAEWMRGDRHPFS